MSDNPYPFPVNDPESTRLDSLHDMIHVLYHHDVLTPIQDLPGTEIVDLGTGSGFICTFPNERSDW